MAMIVFAIYSCYYDITKHYTDGAIVPLTLMCRKLNLLFMAVITTSATLADVK